MAILEEISLVGKNMKSLRKTIYRHFGPRNTGPSEELEVEDMFTISMASKSNTLAAPCNSFSTRMSNSAKNAWLESSFPSISGWRILTLWVIPSVTLHIWWKISTHWGNICADLSGHPGDIAATKLRELPFAFVPFVLAGPRWCGQHKNIEVGKKYRWWLCLFLFQDTQKTHLKQPYIYICTYWYTISLPKNNRSIRFPLHCAGRHAPHKRCCSKGTSTVDLWIPDLVGGRWHQIQPIMIVS